MAGTIDNNLNILIYNSYKDTDVEISLNNLDNSKFTIKANSVLWLHDTGNSNYPCPLETINEDIYRIDENATIVEETVNPTTNNYASLFIITNDPIIFKYPTITSENLDGIKMFIAANAINTGIISFIVIGSYIQDKNYGEEVKKIVTVRRLNENNQLQDIFNRIVRLSDILKLCYISDVSSNSYEIEFGDEDEFILYAKESIKVVKCRPHQILDFLLMNHNPIYFNLHEGKLDTVTTNYYIGKYNDFYYLFIGPLHYIEPLTSEEVNTIFNILNK